MNLLETPIADVFADRKLLDRVATALSVDLGVDYLDGLQQLHDGADRARGEGNRTLGGALSWTRSNAEDVADHVHLLDRRDRAVSAAYTRSQPVNLDRDPQGRVRIEQSDGNVTMDVALSKLDPVERERRFNRACKLDGRYKSNRKQFDNDDLALLESGLDLVKTLEVDAGERRAQGQAQSVAKQLDAAISTATGRREKLRLLEAEIKGLKLADAREAGLEQLHKQRAEASADAVRLLDQFQAEPKDVKVLDQSPEPIKTLEQYKADLTRRVRDRMKELDADSDRFAEVLRQVIESDPSLAGVAGSGVLGGGGMINTEAITDPLADRDQFADDGSDGTYPGSRGLNAKVQARMARLGRPPSAYPQTLQEVMAGLE